MRRTIYFITVLNLFLTYSGLAQINVSVPDTSADPGSFVLISVGVSNLTGLNIISYQFDMKYNNSIVEPTEISVENTISASWENLFYNFQNPGSLSIAAFNVDPLAGEGKLINILFKVVGQPYDSTDLILENCIFSDESMRVQTINGKIKVNSNIIRVIFTTNIVGNTKLIIDSILQHTPYETNWIKGSMHTIEAPSPQDIENGTRYLFNHWSDGGTPHHVVSSMVDTSFTAYFTIQYYLTIISTYGTPQGQGWYDSGTNASFSVESKIYESNDARHIFISWKGDGNNSYTGPDSQSNVVMTNPITESATWDYEYYLQVNSLCGNPYGQGWYLAGNTVSFGIDLITILLPQEHYHFNSWTGQGQGSYSGNSPHNSLVVNNPIIETANWDIEYHVEIGSNPPNLIELSGSGWYTAGSHFTTIETPDTVMKNDKLYIFREWRVNDIIIPGNPVTVCIDSALNIIANYNALTNVNDESFDKIPNQFELFQNYPNPFNGKTIIQYSLPQQATVMITIYNLLGQPVKVFISVDQKAGRYFISWDGRNDFGKQLASGVYLYGIKANDIGILKKMMMLD